MLKNAVSQKCCGQCGLSEENHRELYDTPLGTLNFAFQPDQGEMVRGEVHLCKPCTHEVLSRRLLEAAGVEEKRLTAGTWY